MSILFALLTFSVLTFANPLQLDERKAIDFVLTVQDQVGRSLSPKEISGLLSALSPELIGSFSCPPEAYNWYKGCLPETVKAIKEGEDLADAILFDFFYQTLLMLILERAALLRDEYETNSLFQLVSEEPNMRCRVITDILKLHPGYEGLYTTVKESRRNQIFSAYLRNTWGSDATLWYLTKILLETFSFLELPETKQPVEELYARRQSSPKRRRLRLHQ